METNEPLEELRTETPPASRQVGLADDFIREVAGLVEQGYTDRIHELCASMPAADAAELLTKTEPAVRKKLVEILEDILSPDAFTYLDPEICNTLLDSMSPAHVAQVVNALESDDAISLIDELSDDKRAEIMRRLSRRVRAAVEEGFSFPEGSAGRVMRREFVAIPQFWTVGKTADYLRAAADALPDKFNDIFIVDPTHHFVGAVSLSEILCAPRSVKMDVLVNEDHVAIPFDMAQEQVAQIFRRRDLVTAPVVDKDSRLIGVIDVGDIVDIVAEEAEKDLLSLGGVAESDINRSTWSTTKARFFWLFINLLTAILAAGVISLFEGTIQKLVALAALMPIVASMGGNAGTQTLAVAVRALATKDLSSANAWRAVVKEFLVGSINGVLFAFIMGIIAWGWYSDPKLGLVIGAAMIVNLMAAGLSGIVIPLAIHRFGLDPATSATVFLTTVTDVVGFFVFLGLAAAFLV